MPALFDELSMPHGRKTQQTLIGSAATSGRDETAQSGNHL
jgi:hypothetical protein